MNRMFVDSYTMIGEEVTKLNPFNNEIESDQYDQEPRGFVLSPHFLSLFILHGIALGLPLSKILIQPIDTAL